MKALLLLVFLSTASADYMRRHMVFSHGELYAFGVGIKSDTSVVSVAVDNTVTDGMVKTKEYIETVQDPGGSENVVCIIDVKSMDFIGNSTDPEKNHVKIEYGFKFKGESKEGKTELSAAHFITAEGTAFSKKPFATIVSATVKGEVKAESKDMMANEMNGMMAAITSLLTAEVEIKLANLDKVGVKASGQIGGEMEIAFKIDLTKGTIKMGGEVFVGAKGKIDFNMRWVVVSLKGYAGAGAVAQANIVGGEAAVEFGAALGVGTSVGVKICYVQIGKDLGKAAAYVALQGGKKLQKIKKADLSSKFKLALQGKLGKIKTKYEDYKIMKDAKKNKPNQLAAQKKAAADAKETAKKLAQPAAPKKPMPKTLGGKKSTMI